MPDSVYTQQEVDLILFLEWLDTSGLVTKFSDTYTTHEDAVSAYIAGVPDGGAGDCAACGGTGGIVEEQPSGDTFDHDCPRCLGSGKEASSG